VQQLDVGHLLQQLAGNAARGAAEGDLAGLLLGECHEFRDGLHRHLRVHDHDLAALAEERHRREALHGIVGQALEQVLVGGVRGVRGDEHRVAVRRSLGDELGGDEAVGAPPLLSTITVCFASSETAMSRRW